MAVENRDNGTVAGPGRGLSWPGTGSNLWGGGSRPEVVWPEVTELRGRHCRFPHPPAPVRQPCGLTLGRTKHKVVWSDRK